MCIHRIMCVCACGCSLLNVHAENEVRYDIDKGITVIYRNNLDQIVSNKKATLTIENKSATPIIVEIDKKGTADIIETPDPAVVVSSGKIADVDIKINSDKVKEGNNYIILKTTKIYGNMSPEDKSQVKTFVRDIKI